MINCWDSQGQDMVTLSVIIVTHNSEKYIGNCLGSVYAQYFENSYEVVVVDNASQDTTKSIVRNKYPQAILIENLQNCGVCRARNQGISRSRGSFILFLDHDVGLEKDFLENIHSAIEGNSGLGAVQPKVLLKDGRTIYSAGIHISFLMRFLDLGSGKDTGKGFNRGRYVFGASCAAAIYRRAALEQIKWEGEYFDEDLFYFFEDVDISWRIQKKGWLVWYSPFAVCLHYCGRSRNKDKISQYLCLRNRYLLLLKNEPISGFFRFFIVFFAYDLWRNLFMALTNTGYFLKAFYEVIKLFPRTIRKRHSVLNPITGIC